MKKGLFRIKGLLPIWLFSLFILFYFAPTQAFGQFGAKSGASEIPIPIDKAPVKIDGFTLFEVRGVPSYPARTRAREIRKRLIDVAKIKSNRPDSVYAISEDDKIRIYAGEQFIMNVYPADAELDGINLRLESDIYLGKIKSFIVKYRNERDFEYIKPNILRAFIALIILIAILTFFIWIFRKLNNLFTRRIKHRIDKLENVCYKLIQSDQLVKVLHLLYQAVRGIIIAIIFIGFVNYILSLFPWTRSISSYLMEIILDPVKVIGSSIIDYLPSLIFLIFIILVTRYLLKLVRLFFVGIQNGGIHLENFDAEWAMPTFKIVKFLITVFALVVAFPYLPGSGSGAFQGISVFLGVLFSLGSSSFISNVIAGYSMTYRKAFKRGDLIIVNELKGFVLDQSLMVTRLRSVKNEEIVIPNSTLLNSSVINLSARAKQQGVIMHTTVGIGYETPWRQVDSMLKLAAARTKGILKDPAPFVLKKELGDFAVTYEINAYCDAVDEMYLYYTELHGHILDVFNENNVAIMTPAYVGDTAEPKVVPKDQWDTPLVNKE